jgi:hypothetical protein
MRDEWAAIAAVQRALEVYSRLDVLMNSCDCRYELSFDIHDADAPGVPLVRPAVHLGYVYGRSVDQKSVSLEREAPIFTIGVADLCHIANR